MHKHMSIYTHKEKMTLNICVLMILSFYLFNFWNRVSLFVDGIKLRILCLRSLCVGITNMYHPALLSTWYFKVTVL